MSFGDILLNGVFYVFALAAILGALAVATSRNIVRSAFALLVVLFSTAALYALMKADFMVAAQILIYVGGILVLIIFAIMLTHKITDVALSNESTHGPAAFFGVLCLFFALTVVVTTYSDWGRHGGIETKITVPADRPLTEEIGRGLAGPYLLPFEVISMLLLAALIGAAFLARKEVKD